MSVRVSVCRHTNLSATSVLVVPRDLAALLKKGGNKMRMKAKRAFLGDGTELLDLATLPNDALCVLTTGEEYAGRFPAPPPAPAAEEPAAGAEIPPESSPTPESPDQPGEGGSVHVLARHSWLEEAAVDQLQQVSRFPDVVHAVGLPDLHPGKGYPIGAAIVTRNTIYGHLVGGDIGCGMSLVQLPLPLAKLTVKRQAKWAEHLRATESAPLGADPLEWLTADLAWPAGQPVAPLEPEALEAAGLAIPSFLGAVGTVGGGNHFAELQAVESVVDEEAFAALGLDAHQLMLLVHSGSRGLGGAVLGRHAELHATRGLAADSAEGQEYVALHEQAKRFARRNRAGIARRFANAMGLDADECRCAVDIFHNSVEPLQVSAEDAAAGDLFAAGDSLWVHRKGAAPADAGAVIIPGSRGHMSYLVRPLAGPQALAAGYSLAHGAGRKWHRHKALASMKARYPNPRELRETDLGSSVICEDRQLLYEEAPQAYKDVGAVIQDLQEAGLLSVVAVLRPVVTYKTA